VFEDATIGFCVLRHLALRCIDMKNDFGWDTLQNPRRDMVPTILKNFDRSSLQFARAISVHPMQVSPVLIGNERKTTGCSL
jgi:hypothetical protein